MKQTPILITALLLLLAACSSEKTERIVEQQVQPELEIESVEVVQIEEKEDKPEESEPVVQEASLLGNTVGNLMNGGIAAASGEFVYYSDFQHLFSHKQGEAEPKTIDDGVITQLNAVGDWVYYQKQMDIWKSKSNGEEKQLLFKGDENLGQMLVYDDVIAFRVYSMENHDYTLYVMNTDGEHVTEMANMVDQFTFKDGQLYYVTHHPRHKDWIMKATLSLPEYETERFLDIQYDLLTMQMVDETIYYIQSNQIRSMTLDGYGELNLTPQQQVDVYGYSTPNVAGEYIYFSEYGDYWLYRIPTTGGQPVETGIRVDGYYSIIGNQLYSFTFNEGQYWLGISTLDNVATEQQLYEEQYANTGGVGYAEDFTELFAMYDEIFSGGQSITLGDLLNNYESELYAMDEIFAQEHLVGAAKMFLYSMTFKDQEYFSSLLPDPENDLYPTWNFNYEFDKDDAFMKGFYEFEIRLASERSVDVSRDDGDFRFTLYFEEINGKFYFDYYVQR